MIEFLASLDANNVASREIKEMKIYLIG